MLTADLCGGFRQSTSDSFVYYAVSLSNVWDKSKYYYCPRGYHWACTEEGRRLFNGDWYGTYVYYDQCGWNNYVFGGVERRYFRFRDSAETNAYKSAGERDDHEVGFSSTIRYFAGVVCIKD